jgi:hypothetical protein
MVKIRRVNYFDRFKLKEMISFIDSDNNNLIKLDQFSFFNILHNLLPLKFKFLPESYIFEENKKNIGFISVCTTPGNPSKLVINKLFFKENCFSAAKELIGFIVKKYGQKGISNFVVTIDEGNCELLSLFIDGCGFRQCSSEQYWKMNSIKFKKTDNSSFRIFRNSDAQSVAMLFNDSVITHFKYSVSRTKNEYFEPLLKGLIKDYKFKYVIEDGNFKTIKTYFSLTTSDNLNYILDVTTSCWYECSWDDIFNFAIIQISKRKKDFNLFIKLKKYTTTAESLENYLIEKKFTPLQTKFMLVKDFYKIIKDEQPTQNVDLFSEINKNPVFKS